MQNEKLSISDVTIRSLVLAPGCEMTGSHYLTIKPTITLVYVFCTPLIKQYDMYGYVCMDSNKII